MKRSVILTDRLNPRYLASVKNERTSFASWARTFESAGLLVSFECVLTKTLPTFLSRLNEISGGCEKILPVSGSFWGNFKLLRMILLTA